MENWQSELARAREAGRIEGYKEGVTTGYANGQADTFKMAAAKVFETAAAIGYNTHIHDLYDILDKYPGVISREKLLDELEAIHAIREASGVYVKNPNENH